MAQGLSMLGDACIPHIAIGLACSCIHKFLSPCLMSMARDQVAGDWRHATPMATSSVSNRCVIEEQSDNDLQYHIVIQYEDHECIWIIWMLEIAIMG